MSIDNIAIYMGFQYRVCVQGYDVIEEDMYTQCLQKVFIPRDVFHILLCYSLNSKWIQYLFFHPYTQNTS
jgi:hypothetical protein